MDNIKIYYDGINVKKDDIVKGYTTNPSILKQNNKNSSYKIISSTLLENTNLPVSFEVLSNDKEKMIQEAKEIASWGNNIYIKIPIINTEGDYNLDVINSLLNDNINVNITCIFTKSQVDMINEKLTHTNKNKIIISIFCGRIADTGVSPCVLSKYTVSLFEKCNNIEILWASTREIYNIFEAINCGCDIITLSENIYQKLSLINKDLTEYSKETVNQFVSDGCTIKL